MSRRGPRVKLRKKWRSAKVRIRTLGVGNALRAFLLSQMGKPCQCEFHPVGAAAPIFLRAPSTDVQICRKVFFDEEYRCEPLTPPKVIIDAGANVGLASVWYALRYPDAKIIAIEPEQGNFEMLQANTAAYPNIEILQAALWWECANLELHDPGRGDWAFRVRQRLGKTAGSSVSAFSMDAIMKRYALDFVDLLKIDIEGAEREVFRDASAWIGSVGAIAIELHDRFTPGCSRPFFMATRDFDFEWKFGENVFVTRRGYLRPPEVIAAAIHKPMQHCARCQHLQRLDSLPVAAARRTS